MKKNILRALFILLAGVYGAAAQEGDLTKIAQNFEFAFQAADEMKMESMLTEDFRYFTNVPCSYRDCDQGAAKADYIKGIIDERRDHGFKVITVLLKPIDSLVNVLGTNTENHASFVCTLITKADHKIYKFQSIMDYYFRKDLDGNWKISKIENRIVH